MFTTSSAVVLLAGAVSRVVAQPAGVWATGTMGVTNPPKPTSGTAINQTSEARLLSLNSIDDFCLFAPPEVSVIGSSEAFEVAWCTKARNNARIIPDGTFTGISFLKTDFYVQIMGKGDFTKLNIQAGDQGGELDPHGAEGAGNPVGGNVTVNINGEDRNVEEWMSFISATDFCIRACINANSTYSAAAMCEHKLDEMGCGFVMPGNYNFDTKFESCDADVAYPPGWYPTVVNGQTTFSQFQQFWTGVVGDGTFTVGDTITPSSAFSTPSSSNCQTTSSIANGIALASLSSGATGGVPTNAGAAPSGASGNGSSGGNNPTTSGSGSGSTTTNAASPAMRLQSGVTEAITVISLIAGIAAVGLFH